MHEGIFRAEWKHSMSEIERSQWNSLALAQDSPFLEWEWLDLLEGSGSVGPETGWRPQHLTFWLGSRLVGAAPLYIKNDSKGEFVFDHLWAGTALRLGIPYYPKLLGMSPFTPTGTYVPLHAPDLELGRLTGLICSEMDRAATSAGVCGIGFNFIDPSWGGMLAGLGYSIWTHQGFRWQNEGLGSFEDYLSMLNSNARRNIRRERRSLSERGIVTRMITGDGLTTHLLDAMYLLYSRHNERFGPWGCRFLSRTFFASLCERLRHRVVLCVASPSGQPGTVLAMSMFLRKGNRLYGRYWGAAAHVDFLHFELCYYAPIEWCIQESITWYDPGMGGSHKTRRGFAAVPTFSAHKLGNPLMRRIMELHMEELNLLESNEIVTMNRELPLVSRGGNPF
jgi:uncharacterized protein